MFMAEGAVAYIKAVPGDGFPAAFGRLVDTVQESGQKVIVVGTYDSGAVNEDILDGIKRSTDEGVPVFGVRETILRYGTLALERGSDFYDSLFTMYREPIEAGLVPLQLYTPEILEVAEKAKVIADYLGGTGVGKVNISMVHDGVGLATHLLNGLEKICKEHDDYDSIVAAARSEFCSDEFNARVDAALTEIRGE